MTSAKIFPPLQPLPTFDLRENVHLHASGLVVMTFQSMYLNENSNLVYENRHSVDPLQAVGGWDKRLLHKGGRGAVLRSDDAIYVDMQFICCTEERFYARHLASIVKNNSNPFDAVPIAHSLHYVPFLRPYGTLHLLTNFEFWLKEMMFEYRFHVGQI